MPYSRSVGRKKLAQADGASRNVAADEIGIHRFKARGRGNMAGQNQSRKPGAKRSICASTRAVISTDEPLGTWQ